MARRDAKKSLVTSIFVGINTRNDKICTKIHTSNKEYKNSFKLHKKWLNK